MEGGDPKHADRRLIAIAGAVVITAALLFTLVAMLGGVECEPSEVDTVECDDERADAWGVIRAVLAVTLGLGAFAGVGFSLSREEWRPLGAYVAFAVLGIPVLFAIGKTEVADRPVPKLSQARLLAESCSVSKPPLCSDGIPVTFTVSEEAEVGVSAGPEDIAEKGDRRFESEIVGEEQLEERRAWAFDAGTHEIRFTTGFFDDDDYAQGIYDDEIEPIEPGVYELKLSAYPLGGGNQGDLSRSPGLVFEVLP